jgi:hypothetical protein
MNDQSHARYRVISVFVGILLVSLLSTGCGEREPTMVRAGGTVIYDGAPLAGADVIFVPDGQAPVAFGRTDEQGRFEVKTQGTSGAAPGTYKIAIRAVREIRKVSSSEAAGMSSEAIEANTLKLIPDKYAKTESSGLTASVSDDPTQNEYRFELQPEVEVAESDAHTAPEERRAAKADASATKEEAQTTSEVEPGGEQRGPTEGQGHATQDSGQKDSGQAKTDERNVE